MAFDPKKGVMRQHFSAIGPKMVGMKHSSDIVICAFEYYVKSRSLYNRLRHDFQLLLTTWRRMTSKVSKLNEIFLRSVFNIANTSQHVCMIFYDEVYIKKMFYYHDKQLYGKSVDNPSLLAQTVLSIISLCLNGHSKFLTRLIPISTLPSPFLFEQIEFTVQAIISVPNDVKAIVCDGNGLSLILNYVPHSLKNLS